MRCPFCDSENVRVQRKDGNWRTRICLDCRWTFRTLERVHVDHEMRWRMKNEKPMTEYEAWLMDAREREE